MHNNHCRGISRSPLVAVRPLVTMGYRNPRRPLDTVSMLKVTIWLHNVHSAAVRGLATWAVTRLVKISTPFTGECPVAATRKVIICPYPFCNPRVWPRPPCCPVQRRSLRKGKRGADVVRLLRSQFDMRTGQIGRCEVRA
jgi:hypothetical protein